VAPARAPSPRCRKQEADRFVADFWTHWYFHIPNFVLAALGYTLVGRLLLGIFVPESWDNYIWRAFKALTDPVVLVVRYVTPQVLPKVVVMIFSVLWLSVARVLLAVGLNAVGLLPPAAAV
jgi:uncharacterized protein YggT (Ycf19 family)